MTESKPIVLRSAANPTVRHLVRMRDNRARRKAGRVLVDGWRETAQAIDGGLKLCGIYLPESADDKTDPSDTAMAAVLQHAKTNGAITCLTDALIEKICYGQSFRGVVAEFEQPDLSLDRLDLPSDPLVLVLDQIEKPGNVGAVFRSADAAGVDAILLCESGDPFNPNAIRNSLGCVFHVPSARGSEEELSSFLETRGIRALAARVESSVPLWSADLEGPIAIILGSEADGLGNRWSQVGGQEIAGVRIPMSGRVDSLNVSVSAALIAMEARRRRWPE